MRHYLLEHPNTLGPLLLVLSAILLHFSLESDSILYKILTGIELIFSGLLLFLTYSRSSWIAYLIFICSFALLTAYRKFEMRNLVKVGAAVSILFILMAAWSPIQSTMKTRLKDYRSLNDRIYDMRIGLKAIAEHPVFGAGWFNYYVHAKFQKTTTTLEDIDARTKRGAVHDHSMFLDVADAGGILLGITFILLHFLPLLNRSATRSLVAGLLGVAANNFFDTSCLWLTVYPHFWVLLGLFGTGNLYHVHCSRKIYYPALAVLLLFASIFPAIEDHYLQVGAFFRVLNRAPDARKALQIAHLAAPFDAEPLENLKQMDLDAGDASNALLILKRLTVLKKDFAPYLVEQARIYAYQGDSQRASELLERAKNLDPYTALTEDTYLFMAAQCRSQNRVAKVVSALQKSDCIHPMILTFLHPISNHNLLNARAELQLFDEEFFLNQAFDYVNEHSDGTDRVDAIDMLQSNFLRIGREDLAIAVLQKILQNPQKLVPEDVDYFSELLARILSQSARFEDIRKLPHRTETGAQLINAWLAVAERRWNVLKENRSELLQYSNYADSAELWRALYQNSNDVQGLRTHVKILQRLPWLFRGQFEQELVARSYYDQSDFNAAAKEYQRAALLDYTHPRAHWFAARALWLGGNVQDAEKENARLLRILPNQTLLRASYKFKIETQSVDRAYLTREAMSNDLGGEAWRTCFFLHPPSKIVIPENIKIRSLSTEVALLPRVWLEDSDGVIFEVTDKKGKTLLSKKIDPSHIRADRGWILFEFLLQNSNGAIAIQTIGGGNQNYDWAVWAFQ